MLHHLSQVPERKHANVAGAGFFGDTRWSVVLRAKGDSAPALATLCATYRQPMLAWLRYRGCAPADAEDMVQGCMQDLLRRNFLQHVTPEKGKFRTFLLFCLKNYLRDQHDKDSASKRGSDQVIESLDETNEEGHLLRAPPSLEAAADQEYDRAWAQAALASALRQLTAECARQGHALLFAALEPAMFYDETASSYREIGAKLGMTEAAVKTAAHRIRARLKGLIREEIMQTVSKNDDWQGEIRYLIELLGRPS